MIQESYGLQQVAAKPAPKHDRRPVLDPRSDPRPASERMPHVRRDQLDLIRELRRLNPRRWSDRRLAELLGVTKGAVACWVSADQPWFPKRQVGMTDSRGSPL